MEWDIDCWDKRWEDSRVIFVTRIGCRDRFSYWNETGLKWTRRKYLLRKLFWLIWKQFHSDWIKMCHMRYETSVNETGFKWTEITSLTKILVWSIWNQFHSDEMNIFVKKIILVFLKLVWNGKWHFYLYWSGLVDLKLVWNRPK